MVHVTLADDSSSVVVPSGTITGPLSFWADSVEKASTTYDAGCLVVQAGVAHHVSGVGPAHAQAWPYMLCVLLALAFLVWRPR